MPALPAGREPPRLGLGRARRRRRSAGAGGAPQHGRGACRSGACRSARCLRPPHRHCAERAAGRGKHADLRTPQGTPRRPRGRRARRGLPAGIPCPGSPESSRRDPRRPALALAVQRAAVCRLASSAVPAAHARRTDLPASPAHVPQPCRARALAAQRRALPGPHPPVRQREAQRPLPRNPTARRPARRTRPADARTRSIPLPDDPAGSRPVSAADPHTPADGLPPAPRLQRGRVRRLASGRRPALIREAHPLDRTSVQRNRTLATGYQWHGGVLPAW